MSWSKQWSPREFGGQEHNIDECRESDTCMGEADVNDEERGRDELEEE